MSVACTADISTEGTSQEKGVESLQQPLFGEQLQTRTDPWVLATAIVRFANGGICSGTLVTPDRVLTAAHCFCEAGATAIQFADADGTIPATAQAWPVIGAVAHPNAEVCDDTWGNGGEDDATFHAPWDIAVVTIGPNPATGALPAVTPIPIMLSDPRVAAESGRLDAPVLIAGYGANVPSSWNPSNCRGCSVRRSGTLLPEYHLPNFLKEDECSFLELHCYEQEMWVAPTVALESVPGFPSPLVETSEGDSGAALFFTDSLFNRFVVGGVHSYFSPDNIDRQFFATTGHSGDFLFDALGLPFQFTLPQLQQQAAVYTRATAWINDRARVVADAAGNQGALVVSGDPTGTLRVGVEAFTGSIFARNWLDLADRSTVDGTVISSGRIFVGNNVTHQGALPAEYMRFEDFDLQMPAPAGEATFTVVEQGDSLPLAPGAYGSISVRAGGTLLLSGGGGGLYTFRDITLESGSVLQAAGTTWIFIQTGNDIVLRGDVIAGDGNLMIGAPSAQIVNIGGQFRATIVAPRAHVIGDMRQDALIVGSVFAESFALHQGRWLEHAPFEGVWMPTCNGFIDCT